MLKLNETARGFNFENRPKAILFDFDGTLAKTMEGHWRAWNQVLSHFGGEISGEEYFPLEGTSVKDFAIQFKRRFPSISWTAEQLVHEKEEAYLRLANFEFYPGALSLLSQVTKLKIPIGLVTAGTRNRIERSAGLGFLNHFQSVVTSDRGIKSKPDPEGYRLGASELGINPEECWVVENAPLGIESGLSAGAKVIGVSSTVRPEKLIRAHLVVPSIQDVAALITERNLT